MQMFVLHPSVRLHAVNTPEYLSLVSPKVQPLVLIMGGGNRRRGRCRCGCHDGLFWRRAGRRGFGEAGWSNDPTQWSQQITETLKEKQSVSQVSHWSSLPLKANMWWSWISACCCSQSLRDVCVVAVWILPQRETHTTMKTFTCLNECMNPQLHNQVSYSE